MSVFNLTTRLTGQAQLPKLRFRPLLAELWNSAFIRNILVLMTGSALAQLIALALTPVISRLYSPEDFGVFGSFLAVLGVIGAGVTLDYSQALLLPKSTEDALNLLSLSCVSTGVVTVLCGIVWILVPNAVLDILRAPSAFFPPLLLIAVAVSGLSKTVQAWAVRAKAFKHTSAAQVVRGLSRSGTQVGLGCLGGGGLALVAARILSDALAGLSMLRILVADLVGSCKHIRMTRMWDLAREYKDFPMFSASQNVVNSLSRGLPVLLLSQFYGVAVAGGYAFAIKILSVPMSFVLNALRQVLFQKVCETHNRGGRLIYLYLKITAGLFGLALIPAIILFVWAPAIFTWVFGSQWHLAGQFGRYLIVWETCMFCNVPAVLFARVIRVQQMAFVFEIVVLAARSLVLVAGGMYLHEVHTIILFAVVGAGMNIAFIALIGYTLFKRECEGSVEAPRSCTEKKDRSQP